MIRQHDVQVLAEDSESDVLGEGTFRVVLTRSRRVVTAIDIPDSALGPLHLVFAVSPQSMMASSFATAGFFEDVGHWSEHAVHDVGHGLGKAAEATFNAGSKVATTLARPAFDITRDAAAAGASLIAHVPFVSGKDRKKLEAASRTIMRARLGDVDAQQFIRAVGRAAKDGAKAAQHVGDALLDGTKIVGQVLDAPMLLISKIPKVGGILHELDPFVKMGHMTDKLKAGDFQGLKTMIENDAKMAQGVISLFPGIGTGISAAISAGIGILDGGGALDIAIETAYGAIPIPPGIRQITDAVLGAILQLIHNPHNLTDALLAGARNVVPAGMARDVFDTLANLVIRHMPIAKAGGQLVDTYVQRYAPGIPLHGVGAAIGGVVDAAAHHKDLGSAVSGAVGDVARKSVPGALGEGIAGAASVVTAVAQKKNVGTAIGDAVGNAARKVAPGAVGEGLSAAAHIAGAAAQGKNVGAAIGDAAGGAARQIAPGALGEALAGGAHIAGAAAGGKNVLSAAGDVASKLAPGVVGPGSPLLAAGNAVTRVVPFPMRDAVAKYLPAGVGQAAAPFAATLAHSAGSIGSPGQGRAIPLPSSFTAALPMLPPATMPARSPLLLPAAPAAIHPVGAALSAALGLSDGGHGSTPVATVEDAAKGLVPGAAGALAAQAADLGAASLAALGGQS